MKDSAGIEWRPVTRYSRAKREGTFIICGQCTQQRSLRCVHHFRWSALNCKHCGEVSKGDWLEYRP